MFRSEYESSQGLSNDLRALDEFSGKNGDIPVFAERSLRRKKKDQKKYRLNFPYIALWSSV
jgi:hypothetical protein